MLKMLRNAPSPAQCKRWEPAKPQLGGLTAGGGQAGHPAAPWVGSELLGWGLLCPHPPLSRPLSPGQPLGGQRRMWVRDTNGRPTARGGCWGRKDDTPSPTSSNPLLGPPPSPPSRCCPQGCLVVPAHPKCCLQPPRPRGGPLPGRGCIPRGRAAPCRWHVGSAAGWPCTLPHPVPPPDHVGHRLLPAQSL